MAGGDQRPRFRCPHGPGCNNGPRPGRLAAATLNIRVGAFPMDEESKLEVRVLLGLDPVKNEADINIALHCLHYVLPDPPFVSSHVAAALPLPHDGADEDRISGLPDAILGNIVSRLPVKDGARTAALSGRWRGVWRAAPLVLLDANLLPAPRTGAGLKVSRADALSVAAAVTRILAAHRGPLRRAHLVSCHVQDIPGLFARWLQLLADKGVEELVLVNRPWPATVFLPDTFFGMAATLTRLYLGAFSFPDRHAVQFPHLRELGLCLVAIQNQTMDFILARCPVLEILCIQANAMLRCLNIVSRSLRCVQIIEGVDLDMVVENAPCLERFIIWTCSERDGLRRRVKIGRAPALSLLGYLEPARHVLEIGNIVIKAGTRASPKTMVRSVKILALRVCFRFHSDAKMQLPQMLSERREAASRDLPSILSVAQIMSSETDGPIGKLDVKFWQEAGAIECLQSHVKLMIFYGFQGMPSELSFLKYFLESARMLTKLVIVFCKGSFPSMAKANKKVKPLYAGTWASMDCSLQLVESAHQAGDDKWLLNFESGSDFSTEDPFMCTTVWGLHPKAGKTGSY